MAREFQASAELLPVAVWETDVRGACLWANRRWTELTGQPITEALGQGWRACFGPDDLRTLDTANRDAIRHRLPVDLECRVKTSSGTYRWVRLLATPDVRGEVVVGFIGVAIDVTALRQLVGEHAEREAHLRLLEARSRALLESLPDHLFRFDAQGRLVDFESADTGVLVVTDAQLGRHLRDLVPGEVADTAVAALERARKEGVTQRLEYQVEVAGLGLRDFEGRLSAMKSGGFLGLVRDVTEIKLAERELIAARERALSASSSKSQFLANVSHEIRTPLNGIIGVTQLLRTVTLPDEARDYVDLLEGAGEALLGLVNEVLDLSKIEADRLELTTQPFDLAALVTQATRGFGAQAQRKRLALEVVIDPTAAGVVMGDASRVRQIVNNLVANAVKFTASGSVTVSVRRSLDGVLALAVADTGPGIPLSLREGVFEPFVQVGGHRGQGTGLGLSIAQRLTRLMGGDLRLTSVEGRGSTFEARLPLPAGAFPPRRSVPEVPRRRLNVLLAEDNEVNARLTSAMLEWLGHSVETVGDGKAVVARASADAFDVVFMDVQMPHLDGIEATRQLRALERTARLPIIALTANAMKADELACLDAGMDAYLAKPVTVDALRDVLGGLSRR